MPTDSASQSYFLGVWYFSILYPVVKVKASVDNRRILSMNSVAITRKPCFFINKNDMLAQNAISFPTLRRVSCQAGNLIMLSFVRKVELHSMVARSLLRCIRFTT